LNGTPTDDELLELFQNDPEQAIDLLFRKHYSDLCRRVLRLVKVPEVSEDIAQEVFLDLWRKRERLQVRVSLGAYLVQAARNKALNHLRDHRMDRQSEEITDRQWLVEARALSQLQANDLQERIDALLDRLPERCRLVFVLSRFEELTNKEIAREMGITEKTVENQMNKALRLLRKGLAAYFG